MATVCHQSAPNLTLFHLGGQKLHLGQWQLCHYRVSYAVWGAQTAPSRKRVRFHREQLLRMLVRMAVYTCNRGAVRSINQSYAHVMTLAGVHMCLQFHTRAYVLASIAHPSTHSPMKQRSHRLLQRYSIIYLPSPALRLTVAPSGSGEQPYSILRRLLSDGRASICSPYHLPIIMHMH